MKSILYLILLGLAPALAAQMANVTTCNVGTLVQVPPAGVSTLFTETFEGSEYDLSWTEESNPNGDYDNTGKGMEGSQAFNSTADGSRANHTFSAQSELWVRFQFWGNTLPAGSSWSAIYFSGGSGGQFYIEIGADGAGRIRVTQGTIGGSTTDAISSGTLYYLWLHYKNDGTGSVEFTTDGSKTGTGTRFREVSGNSTDTLNTLYIGLGRPGDIVIDKLQVWTSDPGNNPP